MTQANSLGKIISYPNNPRVWKAQIAAEYLGLHVDVDTKFEMGKTNRTPEFLAKFPYGKVPVMDTQDGPLYESDAIAFYVANSVKDSPLLGRTNYEKALVSKFVQLASVEISTYQGTWYYPLNGWAPYNKESEKRAIDNLKRALQVVDTELATKTFLVGERITLADISLFSTVYVGYVRLYDAEFRKSFPNLTRWFLTVANQPNVKKVIGEVELCKSTMKYVAPAKEKVEKPKKEEKPAKKPAAAEENLDEDGEPKAEKKAPNPLDLLPPSTFILDAWKRFYSNNDPPKAIEYFWQNYDPQGFSIWKVDYKYNNELTAIFMSSNLVGGFFQRLEAARKYAFGTMVITGESNNNAISGYFVFRGQEIPAEVKDAADYESYNFVKVDPKDEKVKATINDYLAWEGKNLPGKFADGKIFK